MSTFEGHELETFDNAAPSWQVTCLLDLENLQKYADANSDARPDQVAAFLDYVKQHGVVQDHLCHLHQARTAL